MSGVGLAPGPTSRAHRSSAQEPFCLPLPPSLSLPHTMFSVCCCAGPGFPHSHSSCPRTFHILGVEFSFTLGCTQGPAGPGIRFADLGCAASTVPGLAGLVCGCVTRVAMGTCWAWPVLAPATCRRLGATSVRVSPTTSHLAFPSPSTGVPFEGREGQPRCIVAATSAPCRHHRAALNPAVPWPLPPQGP